MKVLYVSHTSRVSGAERSLLELIAALRDRVDPVLACPPGELARRAEAAGIRTVALEPFEVGFGSGPWELLRAGRGMVRTAARVAAFSRRLDVDVVHAASARAGIVAGAAALLGGHRPVVDVRDAIPGGLRAAAVRWALRLSARALIFNSRFTQSRFGPTPPARGTVAYPPVDIERLLQLPLRVRSTSASAPVLGVVGQLTPWKGQDDAIRILALLRPRFPAARLRIIGSVVFSGDGVTFDNEAYARRLVGLADELGVADAVEFAGSTDDLGSALSSLDVLLVPSWEEPFGRVVAEGMAAGVPVVATTQGGPTELIEEGSTGFLARPRAPRAWVAEITELCSNRDLRKRIARNARGRIQTILADKGRETVLAIYHEISALTPPSSSRGATNNDGWVRRAKALGASSTSAETEP